MSWPFMSLAEPDVAEPTNQQLTAAKYLHNTDAAWKVSQRLGAPFYIVCALLEKESMGKNIYGHDSGGVYSTFGELAVTEKNYLEFYRRVVINGERSNGVGPLQITWRGFFNQMRDQDLRPWIPYDNILFGTKLFMSYYQEHRNDGRSVTESIRRAGVQYNGAAAYGDRLVPIADKWRSRVGPE